MAAIGDKILKRPPVNSELDELVRENRAAKQQKIVVKSKGIELPKKAA